VTSSVSGKFRALWGVCHLLTPVFDPHFSGSSFGFRPGRSAQQAVRVARRCVEDGLGWVADIDLDRFFDRVLECRG